MIGTVALLGFGLNAPAYAAKPGTPPGQAAKSQTAVKTTAPAKSEQAAPQRGSSGKTSSAKSSSGSRAADHGTSGTSGTSGDVNSPQPRSNADNNGGGANHTGPYDSTRDGSPSGNGNGTGKATGKPCAGCVGKADNKNPKGQYPNGSDHNNGYECDGNHGIGRTNPAHTGCTDNTPPPCVDDETTPEDECGEVTPPCVDDETTPEDECGEVTPPCVDDETTPEDECGEVTPPCVDDESTPEDECGEVKPPSVCIDDLTTPQDECGFVSPPQGGAGKSVSTTPPTSSTTVLPQTGSPAGMLWTALFGLLLMAGGGLLAGRMRARA